MPGGTEGGPPPSPEVPGPLGSGGPPPSWKPDFPPPAVIAGDAEAEAAWAQIIWANQHGTTSGSQGGVNDVAGGAWFNSDANVKPGQPLLDANGNPTAAWQNRNKPTPPIYEGPGWDVPTGPMQGPVLSGPVTGPMQGPAPSLQGPVTSGPLGEHTGGPIQSGTDVIGGTNDSPPAEVETPGGSSIDLGLDQPGLIPGTPPPLKGGPTYQKLKPTPPGTPAETVDYGDPWNGLRSLKLTIPARVPLEPIGIPMPFFRTVDPDAPNRPPGHWWEDVLAELDELGRSGALGGFLLIEDTGYPPDLGTPGTLKSGDKLREALKRNKAPAGWLDAGGGNAISGGFTLNHAGPISP